MRVGRGEHIRIACQSNPKAQDTIKEKKYWRDKMMMEFDQFIIMLVVSSIFFVIVLVKSGSDNASSLLNRIPGPRKLPLIGNLHLLVGKSLPYHVFRDLAAEYGPLMRLQLGGVPYLIVSSVEVAKQVLKTHDVAFANRPPVVALTKLTYNCTDIATSPYGEYWRELRKICSLELLSGRNVKSFQPIREEVNSNMARWIASSKGSPVNLTEIAGLCSFDVITRASFGKELEEKRGMIAMVNNLLKLVSGFSMADLYPSNRLLPVITGMSFKIWRIFRQMDRFMQGIIDEHRAATATAAADAVERSEDLVDVLLKCQEDGGGVHLTDDNIKAVILDMFSAGAETSARVVEWAMSEMVRNPKLLKTAQDEVRRVFDGNRHVDEEKFDELKFLKSVIKETMRLHPPGPFLFPRTNSERCEINGYEIPPKSKLIVNAWALARDPKYWNDAEEFKPERFENSNIDFQGNNLEYIPFGAGRRTCPGISFGLASIEFFLATLLYHFDWKMPNGMRNEELDMSEDYATSVQRKHDLLLIPTIKRPLLLA